MFLKYKQLNEKKLDNETEQCVLERKIQVDNNILKSF